MSWPRRQKIIWSSGFQMLKGERLTLNILSRKLEQGRDCGEPYRGFAMTSNNNETCRLNSTASNDYNLIHVNENERM